MSSTSSVKGDDLFLISRKEREYGISYNISAKDLSTSLIGGFQSDVSGNFKNLSSALFEMSSEFGDELSCVWLSVRVNDQHIKDNFERIVKISNDISCGIKVEPGSKHGNLSCPVYIKDDGYIAEITSYGGTSQKAIFAEKDSNGDSISGNYLNLKKGGTLEGDLKVKLDASSPQSLSTILKNSGSVSSVNGVGPDEHKNVTLYAEKICMTDSDTRNVNEVFSEICQYLSG